MHKIDLNRLDLNLLKVFDALLEECSVTGAGMRLNLAQSSVSHALRRLRTSLGDPLFIRNSRGVQPTAVALRLGSSVSQALIALQAAIDNSTLFDPSTSQRVFNLAMTDVVELNHLPHLVAHLKATAPNASIVVHQLPRDSYRDALEAGVIDLAFGQLPARHHDLLQQYLFDEHFACVMHAKNPLRQAFTLATYMKADHVVISSPEVAESLIKKALGEQASQRRVAMQVPHYRVVPFVLAEADLIAILPKTISTAFARLGLLVERPVPFVIPAVRIYQFWHERSGCDPACQWLRGTIAKLLLSPDHSASNSTLGRRVRPAQAKLG
jgi:DNA-binding transcriptional LysR family regulator